MSRSTRVSLAAFLGLVLASPAVFGGPPKPAPAKPTAPVAVGASLDAINEGCDKAERESNTALRRKRYEQVAAYARANPSAKDGEAAGSTAVDLAEELEDWAGVVEQSDAYLSNHSKGESVHGVRLSRAQALGKLGKLAEAKKAYDEAIKDLDLKTQGPQVLWNAYSGYARMLADIDDVEGAKAQYQAAKDALTGVGNATQVAEAALAQLELIGKEPTAFPDDAKDLDGKAVALSDFKGKVLLIDFWATWCGPCRAEMPNVIRAYEKYHAKGFEIVGISLDTPNDTAKVKAFVTEKKMPWRQVYYPEDHNKVAEAYDVNSIPYTMLVGKDGKVVRTGLRGEALDKQLAKLFDAK